MSLCGMCRTEVTVMAFVSQYATEEGSKQWREIKDTISTIVSGEDKFQPLSFCAIQRHVLERLGLLISIHHIRRGMDELEIPPSHKRHTRGE